MLKTKIFFCALLFFTASCATNSVKNEKHNKSSKNSKIKLNDKNYNHNKDCGCKWLF